MPRFPSTSVTALRDVGIDIGPRPLSMRKLVLSLWIPGLLGVQMKGGSPRSQGGGLVQKSLEIILVGG